MDDPSTSPPGSVPSLPQPRPIAPGANSLPDLDEEPPPLELHLPRPAAMPAARQLANGHTLMPAEVMLEPGATICPQDMQIPSPNHEGETGVLTTLPLDTAPPHGAAPAPITRVKRRQGLMPGDRLGRFKLERVIGQGATATVWAAQNETLNSRVAIKIFHRRDLPFERVLGEARAAAGIPSPHVIWVYDVGTFDGYHSIVMELSADNEGVIARSLRTADITDPEDAARLLSQAARGVEAAHKGSVFHKDIKPANILRHPANGRAQITDFGLANPDLWRAAQPAEIRDSQSTVCLDAMITPPADADDPHQVIRGRIRLGTPEFMAPEQAHGLRPDLDPANPEHRRYLVALDVYGLGATLYSILAGKAPHPSLEDDSPGALDALFTTIAHGPSPCLRSTTTVWKVPRRLAAIVDKAVSFDPLDRHTSASALADDLDAWLATRPTSLDGPVTRLGVHLWRRRATVTLLSILALMTVGSTALVLVNDRTINDQKAELAAQGVALEELATTHAATSQDLDNTRVNLDHTRSALTARDKELGSTKQQLESRSRTLKATKANLAEQELALETTASELMETRGNLGAVEADLATTQAVLSAEQQRAAAFETEADRLTHGLRQTRADLDRTLSDLSSARMELVTTRDALASSRDDLQDERLKLDGVQRELAASTVAERAATERLSLAEGRVVDLQQRVRDLKARGKALYEENQALRQIIGSTPPP